MRGVVLRQTSKKDSWSGSSRDLSTIDSQGCRRRRTVPFNPLRNTKSKCGADASVLTKKFKIKEVASLAQDRSERKRPKGINTSLSSSAAPL